MLHANDFDRLNPLSGTLHALEQTNTMIMTLSKRGVLVIYNQDGELSIILTSTQVRELHYFLTRQSSLLNSTELDAYAL